MAELISIQTFREREREIAVFICKQSHREHLKVKIEIQTSWTIEFESRVLIRQLKGREKGNYKLAIYSFRGFTVKLEEI